MKMNKILAAGIAATMAVTSLSAVVSAEEKSFDMAQTVGESEVKNVLTYYFTDNKDTIAGANEKDWTLTLRSSAANKWAGISAATLEVTGTREGSTTTTTETYSFAVNGGVATMDFVDTYVNKVGQANLSSFKYITGAKVLISYKTSNIATSAAYDNLESWYTNWKNCAVATSDVAATPLFTALTESEVGEAWYGAERSTKDLYHFLKKTTDNTTIWRQDVELLSKTGADNSQGVNGGDANQKPGDDGYGTNPNGFAGLAGQVAKFFNKQTNGTITFKFTPAAAGNNTQWNNGGIPSTEVGLLGNTMNSTAFALFFNYESTTGSLISVGEVNGDALTVTFTIDEVLDALNGNTIGTIHDIYYGMNKGIQYANGLSTVNYGDMWGNEGPVGYLVEAVTLAYDEDAADDTDIEEDDDDDDAPVVDDDDDTTDDVADDDDDATIDEDDDDDDYVDEDDDDDTDVDGDVDEPVTPADDDDDANPGTGVALAVVPALVAAAAVVVSKKRK